NRPDSARGQLSRPGRGKKMSGTLGRPSLPRPHLALLAAAPPSGTLAMTATAVPNLLHPEPELCLNATALSQTLTFAFATGAMGEAFGRILASARLAPSHFRPECFARDLFLGDFVARCLCVRIDGTEYPVHRAALVRELCQPPSDVAVTALRQRVLAELAEKPELADGARRVWLKIRNVEQLLEAADRGKRYDAIGRRVEILRAIREAIELAATAFT